MRVSMWMQWLGRGAVVDHQLKSDSGGIKIPPLYASHQHDDPNLHPPDQGARTTTTNPHHTNHFGPHCKMGSAALVGMPPEIALAQPRALPQLPHTLDLSCPIPLPTNKARVPWPWPVA